MPNTTIAGLFELLVGPKVHSESEMAHLLDLDVVVLRARLVDLKARGILSGPFEDGQTTTWKSWFPTLPTATQALERSGLGVASPVPLRRAWWNAMWAAN
jgi:hypothetical protein